MSVPLPPSTTTLHRNQLSLSSVGTLFSNLVDDQTTSPNDTDILELIKQCRRSSFQEKESLTTKEKELTNQSEAPSTTKVSAFIVPNIRKPSSPFFQSVHQKDKKDIVEELELRAQYNSNNQCRPYISDKDIPDVNRISKIHANTERKVHHIGSLLNWTKIQSDLQSQRLSLIRLREDTKAKYHQCRDELIRFQRDYAEVDRLETLKTFDNQIADLEKERKELQALLLLDEGGTEEIAEIQQNQKESNDSILKLEKDHIESVQQEENELCQFLAMIDVLGSGYYHSLETMQQKMKEFEARFDQWTTEEVGLWFDTLNGGKLKSSVQFQEFKKSLIGNNVEGHHLRNINDFTLKLNGMKDTRERKIVLRALERLCNGLENGNDSESKEKRQTLNRKREEIESESESESTGAPSLKRRTFKKEEIKKKKEGHRSCTLCWKKKKRCIRLKSGNCVTCTKKGISCVERTDGRLYNQGRRPYTKEQKQLKAQIVAKEREEAQKKEIRRIKGESIQCRESTVHCHPYWESDGRSDSESEC